MANNDLLVQSSLPTLPKQSGTQQQVSTVVGPASVVLDKQQSAIATSESLEQQKYEQQKQAESIKQTVAELNNHMQNFNRTLQFSVDETSGDSVVKDRKSVV